MNGRLRFLILKAQLSDTLSRWLARKLPRQVVLFATLTCGQRSAVRK